MSEEFSVTEKSLLCLFNGWQNLKHVSDYIMVMTLVFNLLVNSQVFCHSCNFLRDCIIGSHPQKFLNPDVFLDIFFFVLTALLLCPQDDCFLVVSCQLG